MPKKTMDEAKRMFFYHVANGHASAIRRAVSQGMDPNVRNNSGETPLHVACYLGQTVSVRALLEAGADPYEKDDLGRTPRDRVDTLAAALVREHITEMFERCDDEFFAEEVPPQHAGLSSH